MGEAFYLFILLLFFKQKKSLILVYPTKAEHRSDVYTDTENSLSKLEVKYSDIMSIRHHWM